MKTDLEDCNNRRNDWDSGILWRVIPRGKLVWMRYEVGGIHHLKRVAMYFGVQGSHHTYLRGVKYCYLKTAAILEMSGT